MTAWYDSPAARRPGVRYLIVQGPFGGGPRSHAVNLWVSTEDPGLQRSVVPSPRLWWSETPRYRRDSRATS
jgi:hypothetical protein